MQCVDNPVHLSTSTVGTYKRHNMGNVGKKNICKQHEHIGGPLVQNPYIATWDAAQCRGAVNTVMTLGSMNVGKVLDGVLNSTTFLKFVLKQISTRNVLAK